MRSVGLVKCLALCGYLLAMKCHCYILTRSTIRQRTGESPQPTSDTLEREEIQSSVTWIVFLMAAKPDKIFKYSLLYQPT